MSVAFELPYGRPEIAEREARELAELLEKRRNLAALELARKIREGSTSGAVQLEPIEISMLLNLFSEPSATPDSDALAHLHVELELSQH